MPHPSATPSAALSANVAIEVKGLSKYYRLYPQPLDRLKQALFRHRRFFHEIPALEPVTFSVRRGETVAIIGRNGSGKSTLLQMIAGTLTPTAGSVQVAGRVAALLELGAGFNPDFTGRENVFLNAALLGMTAEETSARFGEIARFADIGGFMDRPVRSYSSGMFVRLAFAVAISSDPDILIVDEALAVGDEAFQRKCFARIEQLKARGSTILFVSHSASTVVQLCQRALLLHEGKLLMDAEPKVAVSLYQRLIYAPAERQADIIDEIQAIADGRIRLEDAFGGQDSPAADAGNDEAEAAEPDPATGPDYDPHLQSRSTIEYEKRGARIRDPHFRDAAGKRVNILRRGRRYAYVYDVEFVEDCPSVNYGVAIKTVEGVLLGGCASHPQGTGTDMRAGDRVTVRFDFVCTLLAGTYFTNSGVSAVVEGQRQSMHRMLDAVMFRVEPDPDLLAWGHVDLGMAFSAQPAARRPSAREPAA